MPDLIIHVYTSRIGFESRLGYIRFPMSKIRIHSAKEARVIPLTWHSVVPDRTSAAYRRSEHSGYIFCRYICAILGLRSTMRGVEEDFCLGD